MKYAKIICLAVGLLLLTYTGIRAYKLSFTHDESYSYLYASQDSFMEIISNRTKEISPNNHILNTLFMKLFDNTTGSSEFSLRMQSLVAHVIYLLFGFLILRKFNSPVLLVTGFLILNLNPYLLDFFSLARGYALSIAFMMMSLYYFLVYLQEVKDKQLAFSLIAACFAILSNFALINFLAAILIIHQVWLFTRFRSIKLSFLKSKIVFITLLVMGIILYEPLRKLIKYKRFDFGGYDGIWKNTVGSEIEAFFYKQSYQDSFFIATNIFILASVSGLILIASVKLYRRKVIESDLTAIVSAAALFLILLINILQHKIMGTPYIMERFALFITPLYLLVPVYLFNAASTGNKALKYTGIAASIFIAAAMSIHFTKCMNTTYACTWKYDASTKEMLKDLDDEYKSAGKKKVRLGITWLYEPGINFYRSTRKLSWLEKVTREGIKKEYDFYYISDDDKESLPSNKIVIRRYPAAGSKLLK
ncbi:MAG TPA: glycosyltransferase family 39 protein [Bacteroidia bacterium]|jgi:hypothetical protein